MNLEFGKTNLQRYYFSPNCNIDFLCTDALVKWNSGVPDASTGSMGGRVGYTLSRSLTAEAGVQQMREYSSLIKDNGWDAFGMGGGTRTFMVTSLRYKTDFSYAPYPEDYQFNYFYADTRIQDPYYTEKNHRGSDGFVFKFTQTFWSDTGRTAATGADIPSNLGYFGTIEHSFDNARPIDCGLTVGLAYMKPQITLPADVILDQITGKVMYIHLNKSTLLAQRELGKSWGCVINSQLRDNSTAPRTRLYRCGGYCIQVANTLLEQFLHKGHVRWTPYRYPPGQLVHFHCAFLLFSLFCVTLHGNEVGYHHTSA